jgi:hypothetical protein
MTTNTAAAAKTSVVKARTALDELGTRGEFKRTEAVWRNWIGRGASCAFVVAGIGELRIGWLASTQLPNRFAVA